ncbi:MAG: alpha/beta hydrolase [Candidatus Lokiarchaeota archaeon]|nr:alpha/beta hydrolase [Candidatus Lokiarchaeota archaeon]
MKTIRMPIFNRSRIREDVLTSVDKMNFIRKKATRDFLELEENKGKDLNEYMKKVAHGKEEFFKRLPNNANTIVELYDLLSYDEQVFLARMYRYIGNALAERLLKKHPIPNNVLVKHVKINEINAEWNIHSGAKKDRVLLYFHGGGQLMLSSKSYRLFTVDLSRMAEVKVLSVNYSLAPEHPFPEGLNDCVSAYKWLLDNGYDSKNIIIGGDSAGGNLTMSTLLKLRDQKEQMPVGAFALSPILDYTLSSKSMYENKETDPLLADGGVFWWDHAYLGKTDPNNPYISPLKANLNGLPPLLLQVSKTEMLYDHSTRFAEKAKKDGVKVNLQEWNDMAHVWQAFDTSIPESEEATIQIVKFIKSLFLKNRTN